MLSNSQYSTPSQSYAEVLKHTQTPSPLLREIVLPPKGRRRPQLAQQATQNHQENLAQIYNQEKLEREWQQAQEQRLLVDEDAHIKQYMDEHPSLDDVLPPRFGPFTPPEIPTDTIIPAPPPFLTLYIAPQPTQPRAFKPWA